MRHKDVLEKVNEALDEVRPHLVVDGGNIEIVDITDDMELIVKWLGNCEFCNMSAMTLRAGIEQAIRNKVPIIKSVKAINGVTSM
jgi:Fe-S cluster biogenesis protein NfuA